MEDRRVRPVENPPDADRKSNDEVTRYEGEESGLAVSRRALEDKVTPAHGSLHRHIPIDDKYLSRSQSRGPVADPSDAQIDAEFGPEARISAVLAAYLQQHETKVGDGRAREDMEIVIQFVIDLCGDLRMGEITPAHLKRVEDALPDVPHPKGVPAGSQNSMLRRYLYAKEHGWGDLKRVSKGRIRDGWHRCL